MKHVFASGFFLAALAMPAVFAQYPDADGPGMYPPPQAAPIERPHGYGRPDRARSFELQPAPGISVRSDVRNGVTTVSGTGTATELRVSQGRADVIVDHPEDGSQILVDLPSGGQVSLLKNGFYTFNASTNTVRVLNGEAAAFTGPADDSKGVKVKAAQELSFTGGVRPRAVEAHREELEADLLPGNGPERGEGYAGGGPGAYGDGFYGGGPYPGGGFGYPYAGLYPYGGFYPYGYGYPFGIGLGFGYYGGFGGYGRFGGFRGGGFRR